MFLKAEETDVPVPSSSRIGKVRGTFLPVEYELAKLISDVENPHESWSTTTPACEWDGVDCNDKGEVIEVSWGFRGLLGTLHWEHLPRSLTSLSVYNNQLRGPVDFSSLPRGLAHLWISSNAFSGELHFEHLPPGLRILNISNCHFSGFVDFSCLQRSSLAKGGSGFDMRNNPELKGSISKRAVPKGVWWGIPESFFTD